MPYLKYVGIVLIALLLAFAFHNSASACVLDDEDPAQSGWAVQCSNTET